MPLRSQGYCNVGKGLLGHNWVFCNGRRPHLEWRQEPQFSFPFLTPITGSLQSWVRRVRPRLVWINVSPLASRVVHGVTGHLSSCMWILSFYPDDAWGCQYPFVLVLRPQVCLRRGVPSSGSYQERIGKTGSFCMLNDQRGYVSNFQVRTASF